MNETVYNREICLTVDQAKDCVRDSFVEYIDNACDELKKDDSELEWYLYDDHMMTGVWNVLMSVNPQCEAHFPPEPLIFQCSVKKVLNLALECQKTYLFPGMPLGDETSHVWMRYGICMSALKISASVDTDYPNQTLNTK